MTASRPTVEGVSEERLRELIRHHKERAIHFEQSSDNGRLPETLAAATPHWEAHDLYRELVLARQQLAEAIRADKEHIAENVAAINRRVAERDALKQQLAEHLRDGGTLLEKYRQENALLEQQHAELQREREKSKGWIKHLKEQAQRDYHARKVAEQQLAEMRANDARLLRRNGRQYAMRSMYRLRAARAAGGV